MTPGHHLASEDPESLLDEVERLARMFLTGEAVLALTRFDHRQPHPAPAQGARRQVCYGMVAIAEGNFDEAERALRSALAAYQELGDSQRELVVLGQIGALVAIDDARFQEGLRLVSESVERLATAPDPRVRATAQRRLAVTLARGGKYLDALVAIERAAALASVRPSASQEADQLFHAEVNSDRAHFLLMLGRYGEAADAASAARKAYQSIGMPPAAAPVYLVYGHTLLATGLIAEAIEAFTVVVGLAANPDLVAGALVNRARALLSAGRPEAAAKDLGEAVEMAMARDQTEQTAYLCHELAEACQSCGRIAEAATAAEQAVLGLAAIGAQGPADRARHLLACLYQELGEPSLALSLLDQLVANLDGFDNAARRGRLSEEAAVLLRRQELHSDAAQRFAGAAESYHLGGMPRDEARARREEALAWRWAEQATAAMTALRRAEAVVADLPGEPATVWESAMLAYDAAAVYAGLGLLGQALDRIVTVAEQFRSVDAFCEAVDTELLHGELLLRAGRPDVAAALLKPALAGIPRDSVLVAPAVKILGAALEAMGCGTEAESLRRRYGQG